MTAWSHYDVLGRIGQGQFSEVDAVRFRPTGQIYACKRVTKVLDLWKERDILALARSTREKSADRTPRLFHAFHTDTQLVLVQTYYACGSLGDILSDRLRASASRTRTRTGDRVIESSLVPDGLLSTHEIRHYASQIVLAIAYLHDNGIVHRDVKPANVLVSTPNAQAVLSDFGSAASLADTDRYRDQRTTSSIIMQSGGIRAVENMNDILWPGPRYLPKSACSTVHGTLDYISPEVLDTSEDMTESQSESGWPGKTGSHVAGFDGTDFGYTHQVDHWSMGAMLFELAYGLPPFYEEKVSDTFGRITKFKGPFRPPLGTSHERCFGDLLTSLLSLAPYRLGRRGPAEILLHPFFAEVDWQHCVLGKMVLKDPPPPIDVEDLYDSFLGGGDWSIDSDDTAAKASRLTTDMSSSYWQGWDRFEGSGPAETVFQCTSLHPIQERTQTSFRGLLPYQTPLRAPVRDFATPYPPGTTVRKARMAVTTARKMSERTVYERMMACVQASVKKRLASSHDAAGKHDRQFGQRKTDPCCVEKGASTGTSDVLASPEHPGRYIEDLAARSAALNTDLLAIDSTLSKLALKIRAGSRCV